METSTKPVQIIFILFFEKIVDHRDLNNKDVEIYVPFVEAEVSIDAEQEIETEIEIPEIRR